MLLSFLPLLLILARMFFIREKEKGFRNWKENKWQLQAGGEAGRPLVLTVVPRVRGLTRDSSGL